MSSPEQKRSTRKSPKKATYIGAPKCFALDLACAELRRAFGSMCYVVGSSMERPDWRDVDVRMILEDEKFAELFPNATPGYWEHDPRWLVMTIALSEWLSKQSGLPVDFQMQPMTHANERHNGPRNAYGIRLAPFSGETQR